MAIARFSVQSLRPAVGKRPGNVLLAAVDAQGRPGITNLVKFWGDAVFADALQPGATAAATFSTVGEDKFLKSWAGKSGSTPGSRAGRSSGMGRSFDSPRIAVSASRKVNLGNYEAADLHITYSGIPYDVDEATMAKIRATAERIVIPALLEDLNTQVKGIRAESKPALKLVENGS